MPSAKNLFIDRIRSLHKSIQIPVVTNIGLTVAGAEHNKIAKMLRNGLAVVAFAALEDFIKKRTSEVLDMIGNTPVGFLELPSKLQKASTRGAISALLYQVKFQDSSISYIQQQAKKIASTADQNYEIPLYSFAYDKPNVAADTVKELLSSFYVDNPWQEITFLASKLQLTAPCLKQSYLNASSRRHKAAHVANTDTPQIDIQQFVKEAFAITIGFDCLLTQALIFLQNHDLDYLAGNKKINHVFIKFRFIKYVDNFWKEYSENNLTKAYRRSVDYEPLVAAAKLRAMNNKEILIIYDENNLIKNWEYYN